MEKKDAVESQEKLDNIKSPEQIEEYLRLKSLLLKYYGRRDVREAILFGSKNREVGVMFADKRFGKRPEVLSFEGDVLEFVKQGVTSFHFSEERWRAPLQLEASMTRNKLDDLRIGWDLVIDIDCKCIEFSAIAADLIIKALRYHGVNSVSCKFSGNKGFHVGVPFESFPKMVKGKQISGLFPEGPRVIADYLSNMIKPHLSSRISDKFSIDKVISMTGLGFNDLVKNGVFDPYSMLEIDTVLLSSRHLFRSQYSLNEKSGLVSLPVSLDSVLKFQKDMAKPLDIVISELHFLDSSNVVAGEANNLLVQAFDFSVQQKQALQKNYGGEKKSDLVVLKDPATIPTFPPCIQKILKGLTDGRKRAVFVLNNFLSMLGWSSEQISAFLDDWNTRNNPPLRDNYISGQLRYSLAQKKKVLPPNCSNSSYYQALGVCNPDSLCQKIKNPVNYSIIRMRQISAGHDLVRRKEQIKPKGKKV